MTACEGGRATRLLSVIPRDREVLLLGHNNPDPDSLASAEGLRVLIKHGLGITAQIAWSGIVGRAENRAMLTALEIPLVLAEKVLPSFEGSVVLVDTQPGRGNNALPPDLRPTAVIDHHPDWGENNGVPFVDVRQGYGAVSTMVTEYLRELEVPVDERLATALFYGIDSETRHLARGTYPPDVTASEFLYPLVDKALLGTIEAPPLHESYFRLIVDAICSTIACDDVLVTLLGDVPYPDATAQIADLLVRLEGIRWAVCLARYEGFLYASLRSNDLDARAGLLLASVLPPGHAGGHGMTAGGRLTLEEDWSSAACRLAELILRKLDRRGEQADWLLSQPPSIRAPAGAVTRLLEMLPLARGGARNGN
jgi:nanoRNase/pAp phosphatase (c-di-AMP/oligoRNAs hydrolase)